MTVYVYMYSYLRKTRGLCIIRISDDVHAHPECGVFLDHIGISIRDLSEDADLILAPPGETQDEVGHAVEGVTQGVLLAFHIGYVSEVVQTCQF